MQTFDQGSAVRSPVRLVPGDGAPEGRGVGVAVMLLWTTIESQMTSAGLFGRMSWRGRRTVHRTLAVIRAEITSAVGFVPPHLETAGDDPDVLDNLWQLTRVCHLCNPLPSPFKEKFLLLMARRHLLTQGLIMGCCRAYDRGVSGSEVLDLLRSRIPPVYQIVQEIQGLVRPDGAPVAWPRPGSTAERMVLWAAVRMFSYRDRRGRCRDAIRAAFGEHTLNHLALLGSYANHERLWVESHPTMAHLDGTGHDVLSQARRRLVAETPDLPRAWVAHEGVSRRRQMGRRERKLVSALAHQDRIYAAVESSEKRFRAVIQSSPFPMMVYAEDGEVVLMNRAWSDMSGWGIAEVPTVAAWRSAAEGDGGGDLAGEVEALYENEQPIEEGEIPIRTPHGTQRVWDVTSVAIGTLVDGRRGVLRIGADVTARRGLEQALWDTNRKISGILESISDGFISLDREWRFIFVNSEAERLLGHSRSDLVGSPIHSLEPWQKDGPLFTTVSAAADEGRPVHDEYCSPVGERWLRYHAYPSEDGVSLFLEDVTEQKRVQQALTQSEERLRLIAANMREVFWMLDVTSGRQPYISPSFAVVWGRPLSEIYADPSLWLRSVHEADREAVYTWSKTRSPALETELEYRVVRPDGSIRWIRDRATPVSGQIGGVRYVVGVAQDITAQREAEAAMRASQRLLRQVADNIGALVFMIADDGSQVLYLGKGVERLWGYTQDQAYGFASRRPWHSAVVPEDRERVLQTLARLGSEGGEATIVCRIRRKDGQIRHVRGRVSAICEDGGGTHCIVGIAEDVSDQFIARC